MKFFDASELDDACQARLAEYDRFIREKIGPDYAWPLRMRDWELDQVLQRLPQQPGDYVMLETGSFNTYLGLWLARVSRQVVASDLFGERMKKSLLRQMGLLPRKPTEAPFFAWMSAMKRAAENLELRTVNLTRMPYAAGTFDSITSISVIEHIPAAEKALAEMYRCLKPGGRLLLTTDCAEQGKAFGGGVRYFTPIELEHLFARYPITSARRRPDFRRENWCYEKDRPVLTAFVEITKPLL